MNSSWIPVSSGKYPPALKDVQVTYVLSSQSTDRKYYKCDVFAFLAPAEQSLGSIRWISTSTGKDLDLDIIAWRYNDDAYDPHSGQDSEIYEQLHDK